MAENFLDGFGSEPDDLQPRATFTEIILIAGEFVEDCQDNLNQSNSNASGKLSSSLIAGDPVQVGNTLEIDVSMNFYGQFINSGVKGTKSGSSTAGYAFKFDKPSEKMVKAIEEWQKRGKASTANTNAKKSISRNEIKNAAIADISKAYAIARSICQHGIAATGFLDKAIATAQAKVADRLGTALRIDVLNSLMGNA